MKKKKPRFFCDGCGAEVAASTERCPRCGKYFSSIRCPRCGFSGAADTFGNGCPACGYSAKPVNRGYPRQTRTPASPAASWLYAVCVALLVMLLGIIFAYVTR
ncbi:MAG: hypothetical protein LBO04_01410 [Spirochaetaceae bacterium]|jgi:predicted RNA-binding Zn-ribbon protein involved in translation (DUF1610 family)|nr:hypothetical protein [Spirochaetaceae bacterium]